MSENQNEYLWDKTGPPDPEVQRLEGLLGRYRYQESAARAEPRRGRAFRIGLAIAAGIAAVALIAWALRGGERAGYRVFGIAGQELVRAGEEVSTGSSRGARVEIGWLGSVDVDPDTRLRVVDCGKDAHRLYLERGSVSARIYAQPRLFQIGTPAGNTIDLGCAYRLEVAQDESWSVLRVTTGQVAFEWEGREVYVPAGAMCLSLKGRGPGAPVFEDQPQEWREALEKVEFAEHPDPELVKTVLDVDRDHTLAIWHLFTSERTAPELKRAAYDLLRRVFPQPTFATEAGLLAGDRAMREAWMEDMKSAWR